MALVSVKALRLYHDKGILVPDFVDPSSGYRYYSSDQFYDVRILTTLKDMGFSLAEIASILGSCEEDSDLVDRLNEKKGQLEHRIRSFEKSVKEIENILDKEKTSMNTEALSDRVEEKTVDEVLVAGYRMKGRYSEIGKGYGKLGRHVGRHTTGPAMCLYHDSEWKEDDADFEPCFVVKKEVSGPDISCRKLEGGRALSIIHKGPYEKLSETYKIIFELIKANDLTPQVPSREIYHKGPGMILKGNPDKYVTEIQILV